MLLIFLYNLDRQCDIPSLDQERQLHITHVCLLVQLPLFRDQGILSCLLTTENKNVYIFKYFYYIYLIAAKNYNSMYTYNLSIYACYNYYYLCNLGDFPFFLLKTVYHYQKKKQIDNGKMKEKLKLKLYQLKD